MEHYAVRNVSNFATQRCQITLQIACISEVMLSQKSTVITHYKHF